MDPETGVVNLQFGLPDKSGGDIAEHAYSQEGYRGDLDIKMVNGEVMVKGSLHAGQENDIGDLSTADIKIPNWVSAEKLLNGDFTRQHVQVEQEGPVKIKADTVIGNVLHGINSDLKTLASDVQKAGVEPKSAPSEYTSDSSGVIRLGQGM